jgi:DNA mismatch repair protein MutL
VSKIKILPEILSNKIAAGEVVERPASAVKELVENALDAGGDRILIDVEKGGGSLIQVADNGCGMSADDALLAIERYATSKIYKDEDLFSITTLGFRGEALPSIASVSRLVLETRRPEDGSGTRVEMEGGKIKKVSQVGAPPGTLVSVRSLFFNTPARRKFMKTPATEMGHISDITAGIALAWPRVRFRLRHDGRVVKDWTASDPIDRAADVLGQETRDHLLPLDFKEDGISITGWAASPRAARTTSRGIYLYVNGRHVRDRVLQHALFAGYQGRLMKGQFPVAVVFLEVPHTEVDVNVHPAKNEVRFARAPKIHGAVSRAVIQAFSRDGQAIRNQPPHPSMREPEQLRPVPRQMPEEKSPALAEFRPEYTPPEEKTQTAQPVIQAQEGRHRPFEPDRVSDQAVLWDAGQFKSLRIIGQFHNTYILCEGGGNLILIDQHAAHERVLFENLKTRSASRQVQSQQLLIPETIEFNHGEADVLTRNIPAFENLGFEIEPFGGSTFAVKAVPALISDRSAAPLIFQLVEKMAETGIDAGLEGPVEDCLKLIACHGAIRAHQSLSTRQIEALLEQLDGCQNPSHCPHGRPTWIKWSPRLIEKAFGRIV